MYNNYFVIHTAINRTLYLLNVTIVTISAKTRLVRTSMCFKKNEIKRFGEITRVTKKILRKF